MNATGRIGLRLRVDPGNLSTGLDELVVRTAAGVDKVWQLARSEPRADGQADDAVMGKLSFAWKGRNARDVLPAERARIEERLRRALVGAAKRVGALPPVVAAPVAVSSPLPAQAATAPWTIHEIEFRAVLRRLIEQFNGARTDDASRRKLDYLKSRYADLLDEPVAAVATVVDVQLPYSWRKLATALLGKATSRFDGMVPFYFWDNDRRNGLIELDRKHLSGALPELTAPSEQPPEGVDFTLVPGTRLVFVAFGMPELTVQDVAFIGDEVSIDVPLSSLLYEDFFPTETLTRIFKLTEMQMIGLVQEWADYPITVRIVPLTPRRALSVASLRILMDEQAVMIDPRARYFGKLRLLSRKLLAEMPFEVAEALRTLADDVTIGSQQEDAGQTHWRTNARGVYLYPLLDKVIPGLVARTEAKVYARESLAPDLLLILWMTDDTKRSERLGKLIDELDKADWLLFEVLLDELAKRHEVAVFFETVGAAKGWYYENMQRRYKVTGLAVKTRYANEPALLRLIEALRFHGFENSIIQSPHHRFDVASQSIFLLGDPDKRVTARGQSSDDKRGVVSEASDGYYSETAKVYQPNPALLERLSKPAKIKMGEIVRRMACASNETLTEKELIGEAMNLAMRELPTPPTEKDFVAVKMRSSLRVLALEEPIIDGVPQLRLRVEPVAKIGDGPWEATGRPELITPGLFEARMTSYHVTHMVNALGVLLLAETVVGGAIFIVVAGIATLGELVLMIVVSEVMYFWTTPKEDRSLQGFLEAALFAELQLVGFKALSAASMPLKLAAGKLITGKVLGSVASKWIAFGFRSAITAGEVATTGVLDLFANDLFHMTRCRGFSSPAEYWDRFKSGYKLGLFFEFALIPGVSLIGRVPAVKAQLTKVTTYLDAALVLRDSGLGYRQIAADVLLGQQKFEQALQSVLDNAPITQALASGSRRTVSEFLGVLWKETQTVYQQRAYKALFEMLNVPLGGAASKGLSRLLGARTEKEIDHVLQLLKQAKLPADHFLGVLGQLDDLAAAELMKPGNLSQLARAPKALELLGQNPPAAYGILRDSFRGSVEQFENYLNALEKLPPDARNSVLRALQQAKPLPADSLLRAAQALGVLDAATLDWMRRFNGHRIKIDALFANGGKPFRDFVDTLSKWPLGEQTYALRAAEGTVPARVLHTHKELQEALAKAAKDIQPEQSVLLEQVQSGQRPMLRDWIKKRFVHGPYQTVLYEAVLLENRQAFAAMRQGLRQLNPDAIYGIEAGGPYIADVAAAGEAQIAAKIVRVPKTNLTAAMKDIRDRVEAMIKAGHKTFAFTDVYFSGSAYNLFQKEVMRPLAQLHPDCTFTGFWMRSQVGFEVGGFEVGSGIGPVLELPAYEGSMPKNMSNQLYEVSYVIGEDVSRLRDAKIAEPIYVFDNSGAIVRVVEPAAGDKTTRDLIIRLLSQ